MRVPFKPKWLLRPSTIALLISTTVAAALLVHQWVDQKQCFARRPLQLPSFFDLQSRSRQELILTQGTLRLDQLARMPDGRTMKLVWSYRNTTSTPIEIGPTDIFFARPRLMSEPAAMLVDLRTGKAYFPTLDAGVATGRSAPRDAILEPGELYAAWTFFANVPSDAYLFDVILGGSHQPFHCVSVVSPP